MTWLYIYIGGAVVTWLAVCLFCRIIIPSGDRATLSVVVFVFGLTLLWPIVLAVGALVALTYWLMGGFRK